MSKYIDFDSTYRNRTDYINPNNFVVPIYLNQQNNNFYDPILLSSPFTASNKPILQNTTQFSVDNINITLDSQEPTIENFYKNNNLQIDNEFHKIIAYDGITKVATVDTAFSSVPVINTHYTIRKAGSYFNTNILIEGEGPLINRFNLINRAPSLTQGIYDRTFFTFDNGSLFGKTGLIINYNPNTTNNAWIQQDISGSSSIISTVTKLGFVFVPTNSGYFKSITLCLTSYESINTNRILNVSIVYNTNVNMTPIFSQNINVSNTTNISDITFIFNSNTLLYQKQTYTLLVIDVTPKGINTGFVYIYGITNTNVYTSINTPTYPKMNMEIIPLTGNLSYSQPTLDGGVNVLPINTSNSYNFNIINDSGFIPDSIISGNYSVTNTGSGEGYSVAINENSSLMCWGAPYDNNGIGAVYTKDTTTNIINKIIPFDNIGNCNFGNSISIYNTTLVVGGYLDNSNIGAIWIYNYINNIWVYDTKIIPTGYINFPKFGSSCKLNNNILIVGGDNDNNNIGKIWIYNYTSLWVNTYISNITNNLNFSRLGCSVDINSDGSIAVAGGYNDNNGIGAIWIFTYISGNYTYAKIIPTNNSGNSNFGFNISLSNNYIAIGGPNDTTNKGAVWIYFYNGSNWVYTNKLFVIDALNGNQGYNVLLNNNATLLTYSDPNYDTNIGIIRNFTRTGTTWNNIISTTNYTYSNTGFAKSIAFSNQKLICGNTNDSSSLTYISQTNECKYIGVINNNFYKQFNKNIYSFTIPPGTTNATFKLWGGGGASAGGSGGYVEINLNVTADQIYYLTVGGGGTTNSTINTTAGGGNTGDANDSAIGGGALINSTPNILGFVAGGGGQYTALHLFSGGKYILIACAGGGGGGSSCYNNTTLNLNYGGGAGQSVNGAVAGNNGIGGSGNPINNYDAFATTIGVNVLSSSGGGGSNGVFFNNFSVCGGGGGGYGGGSSNVTGSSNISGNGAGGGNYIPSTGGNIVSSSGNNGNNGALNGSNYNSNTLPPNNTDIDYVSGIGIGGNINNNGGNGLIVVSLNNIGTFYLSNDFGVNFINPKLYKYLNPNNYNLGITNFTITDANISKILVKLWGAGGGSVGGSGGYVQVEVSVSVGDVFYVTVGGRGLVRNFTGGTTNGGNTGNGNDSAIGGSCIISSTGGVNNYRVGSGGQYSALHKFSGGKYYLIACSGGGGGGGVLQNSGINDIYAGGGANINGINGSNSAGGNNGIGGNGSANSGSNYNSSAITTGVNSLNLMGGNGGNGNTSVPGVLRLSSSGGGGGYGGGGSCLDIPGAGGGGNYIPSISGIIINSSGSNGNLGDVATAGETYPPNNTDTDYISAGGNFGIGGNYFSNGTNGLIVVKYYKNDYFYTTSFTINNSGQYINCINVNNTNNLYTSNDYGNTFVETSIISNGGVGPQCNNAYKIVSSNTNQYITIYDNIVGGFFVSSDYGSNFGLAQTIDNNGLDLCSSSDYSYLVYTTNGNDWIYWCDTNLFVFNPYNITGDMYYDFNNYGGPTSVCIGNGGLFVGVSVNVNFYYSYDSGTNWNVYYVGYIIKSVSANYNGSIVLINISNENIVGIYSNNFCNSFNNINGNSLYNYGCFVGSSGRRMFLSSPYLINTTNYGSSFNNLNTNIYCNSNRGIVCNNGLVNSTINNGSISVFNSNAITIATIKKLQIPLIVYSSNGNRILQVGISDINNNVLYTNNITLNNNINMTLTDLNINYTLPEIFNTYKFTLRDISGNNNGYINIFGISSNDIYISDSDIFPQINMYGDTNNLSNTLLFQQSTNNVKVINISNSQVGFKIIPNIGGYFSLYVANLTCFGNRILNLNLYNGSGLGGSLLYATSINVGDYGYNSYNSNYNLPLSFPINLIGGNIYTVGLSDSSTGNYINMYGINSNGSYITYNTTNYVNSYVYTSGLLTIYNQPNNDCITTYLSTTTKFGYIFYPNVSGYLYTFSIYLTSFDITKIRQITSNLILGNDINGSIIATAVINIGNILSPGYVNIAFDPQTIPILNKDTPYIITILDTTTTANTTGFIRLFGINSNSNYVSINTSIYPGIKLIIPQYIVDVSPGFPIDSFLGDGNDIISFSVSAKDNASTLLYGGGKNVL